MSNRDCNLNLSLLDDFCDGIRDPELREAFRDKILSIKTDADGNFSPTEVEKVFKNGGNARLERLAISFVETTRESVQWVVDPENGASDAEAEVADPGAIAFDPEDDVLDPEHRAMDSEDRVTDIEEGAMDPDLDL